MAKTAGFSATALSLAAAGERLPSLAVVRGYVRACGGEPDAWEPRWKEAEADTAKAPADGAGEAPAVPYRGLARFEPDDRELFFGRERMVEELRELVCGHRFAVVFGASGSGRSSLLRAGLIPRLREETARRERPAVLRILIPGPRPATTYGHLLAPAEGGPESWVVVDQFEEVFTLCRDRAERERFLTLLLAARGPDSRLRVLIAVRADFFARCAEHRGLAEAVRGAGLPVGPMTADELRDVVVRPAQAAGLIVERELTARIVDDVLDRPGALPMLSHALLETWRRRRGRLLTPAGYEAAGGVRGAIAASAGDVYAGLSPAQAEAARRLLLRMVEPGQGTADARRPLTSEELAEWPDPDVSGVVERLARARLVTVDEEGVQLVHEALLTCWPRLHGWIEEDRERLRHHRRLAEAARVWLEHDRDPGALYRGTRLARAEELFPDPVRDASLMMTERAFLPAALDAQTAEQRAAARTTRRSRLLTGALSAVLAVALAVGVAAWREHDDNRRQHTENAARRIAEAADALRTTDPRTALLLGVAAWRTARLPETRRALLGSLLQPESDAFTDPVSAAGTSPADTSPDGGGPADWGSPARFLASAGHTLLSAVGGTWRTWDVTDHRAPAGGRLPAGATVDAAAPNARTLALFTDGGIRMWDTAAGRWTGAKAPLPVTATVAFTADGHAYLVHDGDQVRLHAAGDGRLLLQNRARDLTDPAVSADGRLVAVCPAGQAPQLWDTGAHRTVSGSWERADGVCDDENAQLVLGPGDRFAAVTGTGVTVWDTRTGGQLAAVDDAGAAYASVSGDGAFLATADRAEIRVWRLASPTAPVFRHALNNQHLYGGPTWDPGRPVLRYPEGGTVHSLDLGPAITPAWRGTPVDSVRFSPDGRTYATAERTGSRYVFRLRTTADDRPLRTLPR